MNRSLHLEPNYEAIGRSVVSCFAEIIGMLSEPRVNNSVDEQLQLPADKCYNAAQLCNRFPQLSFSKVKDRVWRESYGFPCHQLDFGCKCTFHEKEVEEWIKNNMDKLVGDRLSRSI